MKNYHEKIEVLIKIKLDKHAKFVEIILNHNNF